MNRVAAFFRTLITLSAWFRSRKYKSGTGWCFWRWTDVDSEYILRLHVVKTPWFAVCLHWIRKPDAEPWLHDHPVSFLSIILRGSYTELRRYGDGKPFHKVRRWFNFVRASYNDRHRIIFTRKNTLTLCLMGPKTREWGFHVPPVMCDRESATRRFGWIDWRRYYARLRAGEDMRDVHAWAERQEDSESVVFVQRVKYPQPKGATWNPPAPRAMKPATDFDDESPTVPYGAGVFGKGPYGG